MKKNLLLAAVLSAVCIGLNMRPADAAVVSTNTAVVWPDYHAKPWKLNKQIPMTAQISHTPKNNDFVIGAGKFNVSIGTVSWYFDNADPDQASMAVAEGNILGNGPAVRTMMLVDIGRIDFQVNVNGKWTSIPPANSVSFTVIDEDSVITKNTMIGVLVTVADEDGKVLMKLRFDNKNKKK